MKILKNDPMYIFLIVMSISATVGLQAWQTLFNNFAVEMGGLQGEHIGIIQSVREIPGALTLLVVYVILIIKEYRLSALSISVLGLGLAVTGIFPSLVGLMATTFIMSLGFHYYETTNQSLTLQYFDKDTSPIVFGKQRSYAAASAIAIGLLIYLLAFFLDFLGLFIVVGIIVVATGIWGFTRNPGRSDTVPQRKTMIVRKSYWLFYFLTFMAGARRQIFMAFAVFLMVEKFGYTVQEITILFVINNLINYFISPWIGRGIVRFGERKMLSAEYFSLIVVFLGYAVVESKMVIAVLYVLDHIFFNFSIAIKTYFQKVGDPRDIAPSMAVGFTINHFAAVVLPALGGMLWMIDYRIPFVAGAGMSLISLMAVQLIRIPAEPQRFP